VLEKWIFIYLYRYFKDKNKKTKEDVAWILKVLEYKLLLRLWNYIHKS